MPRLVIDPVTRVGGPLRVEAEVAGGVVEDAWIAATMFRGIETILEGRDPRQAWLFAQRACGTCSGVYALASVRAVENALGLAAPRNARLIRNLVAGSQAVQDHVTGFYQRQALDWVDVPSAIDADPAATSALARTMSDWPLSSAAYFGEVREKVAALVRSAQPGPFGNGYWGHPAYRLSPETNLVLLAHSLEALEWRRAFARALTLLGGKSPHPQTFLVGGMALAPEWGGPDRPLPGEHPRLLDRKSPTALGERGLADLASLLGDAKAFVEQVYLPDVLALAEPYREWAAIGTGIGNYLAVGEFPEDESGDPALGLPRGRLMGRDLTGLLPVEHGAIGETVAGSHYRDDGGDAALRHPWVARAVPRYGGPPLPYATLEGSSKYSWLKTARYEGEPMEVGPLARMLVASAANRGDVRAAVDRATAVGDAAGQLRGTLGRIVARAVEAQVIAGRLAGWQRELVENLATGDLALADITSWDPASWPAEAQGWSLGEAPRGALGHWVTIRDRRVARYQVVDATTWNGSPRDSLGRRGPCEEALVGTPVVEPARPLELLRVVHSFDPCPACGVH